MPVHVDSFILIIDAYKFGYKQMFVNHVKGMLHFLQSIQRGRQYCTCVIRGNMVMRTVQSLIVKFLEDGAKNKVRLLGKNYKKELLKLIDASQLPEEYGGALQPLDKIINDHNIIREKLK